MNLNDLPIIYHGHGPNLCSWTSSETSASQLSIKLLYKGCISTRAARCFADLRFQFCGQLLGRMSCRIWNKCLLKLETGLPTTEMHPGMLTVGGCLWGGGVSIQILVFVDNYFSNWKAAAEEKQDDRCILITLGCEQFKQTLSQRLNNREHQVEVNSFVTEQQNLGFQKTFGKLAEIFKYPFLS